MDYRTALPRGIELAEFITRCSKYNWLALLQTLLALKKDGAATLQVIRIGMLQDEASRRLKYTGCDHHARLPSASAPVILPVKSDRSADDAPELMKMVVCDVSFGVQFVVAGKTHVLTGEHPVCIKVVDRTTGETTAQALCDAAGVAGVFDDETRSEFLHSEELVCMDACGANKGCEATAQREAESRYPARSRFIAWCRQHRKTKAKRVVVVCCFKTKM